MFFGWKKRFFFFVYMVIENDTEWGDSRDSCVGVGWLVGWLVGLFVCWLVGWFVCLLLLLMEVVVVAAATQLFGCAVPE